MPYFIKIGKIAANKSGVGSRGWYVRRRTTTVLVRWGSVDVVSAGSVTRFYWGPGWPQERVYHFRSIEEAVEFARSKSTEKLGTNKNGGYERLPLRQRIRARP